MTTSSTNRVWSGPGLALWIEVDVTCRLHDGRCAWDHGARRSLRRDRLQASRSRHRRVGKPILSPLIPGCSVAGDQDPSRLLIRGPMPRRCPECELATPRQRPPAPSGRADAGGGWLHVQLEQPGVPLLRRLGPRRAEGVAVAMFGAHWFGHAHLTL